MIQENRNNNFNLLRFIAATQVFFAHTCHHLQIGTNSILQLLWKFLLIIPGVPIFFILSGLLISASYERSPNLTSYFIKRCLRIYPALWFALGLSILMLTLTGYWPNHPVSQFAFYKWVIAQLSIVQFYNPSFLQGFGIGVLNGSLWTISVELQFYLLIPLIYLFHKRFNKSNLSLILLILIFILLNIFCNYFIKQDNLYGKILHVSFIPHIYFFLLGIFLHKNKSFFMTLCANRFLFYFLAYAIVCFVFKNSMQIGSNSPNPLIVMLLALVIFSFGHSLTKLNVIFKTNDISYGIYIYHMLVINLFVQYGWTNNAILIIPVFILTFILATLSWFFIEKPSLNFYITKPRQLQDHHLWTKPIN